MAPVTVECPIDDCDYTATHAEPAVVAALLGVHATVHVAVPQALDANAKMEKLKRPTVALAGTGEAWSYFITRRGEYKTGTKLVGHDVPGSRTTTGMLRRRAEERPYSRSWQEPNQQCRKRRPHRHENTRRLIGEHNGSSSSPI